jgi:hypothetical protein
MYSSHGYAVVVSEPVRAGVGLARVSKESSPR